MVIGLGTGSTTAHAITGLGAMVRAGLRIRAIPTSERTAALARAEQIPLTSLAEHEHIDLTIDGADEIARDTLDMIKGLGGALLREKIVAQASKRLVIIADHTKLAARLGEHAPVPVEITPFGWNLTTRRLEALGATPVLRQTPAGAPYLTDGHNHILDCRFLSITNPADLQQKLKQITGVIETGLFLNMADDVFIASPDGIQIMHRQ